MVEIVARNETAGSVALPGMPLTLSNLLLILAFLCEGAAAVQIPSPRLNLVALGLALGFLAVLIGRIPVA